MCLFCFSVPTGANAWLNAVIAREIHKMLRCSHHRQRYFPPKRRVVALHAIVVYLWAAVVASLGIIPGGGVLPMTTLRLGAGCTPVEYNTASTIFFFTLYLPLFCLIPVTYVLYVAFDVFRKKLLPLTGKTRELAIYFFRLIAIFVFMWLPTLIFVFFAGSELNIWVRATDVALR